MVKKITIFLEYWRGLQTFPLTIVSSFFKDYVHSRKRDNLRYLSEMDLQAYLYLNLKKIFPECVKLILFERPLIDKTSSDAGCYDFVFLTDKGKIKLIETKYLDLESSGSTASSRRSNHRKKAIQQVLRGKDQLISVFGIPEKSIDCAIFTNDYQFSLRLSKTPESAIEGKFVFTDDLREWLKKNRFSKNNKWRKYAVGYKSFYSKFPYP